MRSTVLQTGLRLLLALVIAASGWDVALHLATGIEWGAGLRAVLWGGFHFSLLAALGSALLLVVRWPEGPAGRLIASFIAFASLAWTVRVLAPVLGGGAAALPRITAWAGLGPDVGETMGHASLWLAMTAFVRFTAVFPEPLTSGDFARTETARHMRGFGRWGTSDSGIRAQEWLNAFFRLSLRPRLLWGTALLIGVGAAPALHRGASLDPWIVLEALPIILLVALLVENLGATHDRGGFADRRMQWVLAGFVCAEVAYVLFAAVLILTEAGRSAFLEIVLGGPATGEYAALMLILAPGLPFLAAAMLVATHYTGRIDPGLVIRRTTLAGVVALIGIAAFAAAEELLSSFVVSRMGLPEGWGSWVAAGAAAALIALVRDRAVRWADALRLDRLLESRQAPGGGAST